jgi:hypothetical protein
MLISTLLVFGALCGCASQPKPAAPPPPNLTELPEFPELQQTLPINVRVEGRTTPAAAVRLVPDYTEPPLTEKEKKALGIRDDKNVLAFYQKPRGPEHGVSTNESRVETVIQGHAGGVAMRNPHGERLVAIHGAPAKYDSYMFATRVAWASPLPSKIYGYVPAVYVVTAIDGERHVAGRHTRVGQ